MGRSTRRHWLTGVSCQLVSVATVQAAEARATEGRVRAKRPRFKKSGGGTPERPMYQKNLRRLELSISQNTPHGRWGQGSGSVDPKFAASLPFPVPEIPEFVAFRDSGKIFQRFSRHFPGVFLGKPRTDPGNSHSLIEFSDCLREEQQHTIEFSTLHALLNDVLH